MAEKSRRLRVSLSPAAATSLDQIWDWNAQTYGTEHAAGYISFLRSQTAKLAILHFAGKSVPSRPNLSYVTIKKRRRGHGHVAVYEIIGDVVYVLNFYHTAQNWQAKFLEEIR